jgi:STE24 endopeptidase
MTATIFIAYLLVLGASYWLKYLNLSHLKAHGHRVPPEFQGVVDESALRKISDYTFDNSRVGLVESVIDNVLLVLFLFAGLIVFYDRWIASLAGSFVWGGALFFLVLLAFDTVMDIPFSLYRNFIIENRYGFNTMTAKLWLTDLAKTIAISMVFGAVVIVTALSIIQLSPDWWWLQVWAFLLVFGVFVMYISPYVIEPLFFKFQPLAVEGLEERIRTLMGKAGLAVSRVFQVDASRRSRHSNAYFTGIGRVKRIVLFDTLIQQMTQDELLAVLAHEVGHWKKRHVLKRIALSEAAAFAGLFLASRLLRWEGLPGLLGLGDLSFYGRAIILGFLGSIVLFPLTPLSSFLSRRDEWEADRFASDLTENPGAMASGMVKLSRENLSNLHPHPLYAKFYYSHPPVVERIKKLRSSRQ